MSLFIDLATHVKNTPSFIQWTPMDCVEPLLWSQSVSESFLNAVINSSNFFLTDNVLDFSFHSGKKVNPHLANYTPIFPENSDFSQLDVEIKRVMREFPDFTAEEALRRMTDLGSDGMNLSLHFSNKFENTPIDYTNLYNHDGQIIDVSKLTNQELFNLQSKVDDIDKFESLEHVRSTFYASTPNVKLYYPEPFIASASFIHNDIGFLHILQYQFWLWFLFIFLIVFFFISFLCVLRWCSNRNQPRRETRGVSRSKCGDLITATVPVTWAISIIVSESTDAMDYYDGFNTSELIVGVRAYQWGWHYYYPKQADLNYNVKPNYSAFVGNSLKYTTTTGKKLNSNSLWKFYQTKLDDTTITPAHLLVLPSDNSRILNLMNFKDIGTNLLEASRAFKQIRAGARIYTTNLVHTPSPLTAKYVKINNLFFNENDLMATNNFGLKRQHTLTSASATTAVNSTFLDRNSLNKFLNYNLQYNNTNNTTNLYNSPSDLWTKANSTTLSATTLNNLNLLLSENNRFNSTNLRLLSLYPNLTQEFGDNSDVKPTHFPLRKLLKKQFTKPLRNRLNDRSLLLNSTNLTESTSQAIPFFQLNLLNTSKTSKDFMLNYAFQSVASEKQSVRKHKNLNANTTNYNLSFGINSLDSNLNKLNNNSNYMSPFYSYSLQNSNWSDLAVFNKLASNRIYYNGVDPIASSNAYTSRLNFDTPFQNTIKTFSNIVPNYVESESVRNAAKESNIEIQVVTKKYGKALELLGGDRAGEDKSATSSYWTQYWSNSNTTHRLSNILDAIKLQENSYLPLFTNYYDYDFRNAAGIRLLEDALWESTYSAYLHQDYLNIYNKYRESYDPRSLKWGYTNTLLLNADRDYNQEWKFGTNAKAKELKNVGTFYANSIQTDEYFLPLQLISKRDLSEPSFIADSLAMDESYSDYKNLSNLFIGKSSLPRGVYNNFNYPQSHHAVLNNFRSDFEDFSHFQDTSLDLSNQKNLDLDTSLQSLFSSNNNIISFNNTSAVVNGNVLSNPNNPSYEANPTQLNWSRFSSPVALRRSAKSAMTTFQAYQKVFKLRYEEGRAHVRLTDFADSASTQPFTTEQQVKYNQMLGKTKLRYFNTNYNVNRLLPVFNNLAGLTNSLNYYFFDFPFLDGVTNDPTRHVWFDAFIKYAQREVGGSSVSKYTIVGVPFYKKKYDFNVKQGKQLADTELYFNRIATARKSYLPQWIYTPYLYTRSNVWFADDKLQLLRNTNSNSYLVVQLNLRLMNWYWQSGSFSKNTSLVFTPSYSNSMRNTVRPYVSIQSYYYNLNALTDILTRREYLYRQILERRNKILELPSILRATPRHPLVNEIKASFLLIDPITYNSEYSRELYFSTLQYYKFMMFKGVLLDVNKFINNLPINLKLVNEYLFFHFIDQPTSTTMGNRNEMRKSQFKPLKKGISSMMRLQGTGAVAMPIEIRLQVLASSKDVIHSWAIPSAGIKIDCIPGYSSHKIMIFFTPGIYWGQCMEICGRYHHWMPIILYFMKRDLFFLWCTHFLSKKDPYATKLWEANDRQFADYIGFVSYDKSSWLTEISKKL